MAALEKLRRLAGTSELVCPHAYGREHRNWWTAALKEAKVQNFHWHDLRHTFASRLVMAGVDLYTVKELLGHAVIAVTMRYAHLAPSHLQAAVDKLASATVTVGVTTPERVSARIQ
jgi:integrase